MSTLDPPRMRGPSPGLVDATEPGGADASRALGRPAAPAQADAPLHTTLARIAAVWVLSDLSFYFLLPALGLTASYNDGFVAASVHYVYWTGIAIIAFSPLYAAWFRNSPRPAFDQQLASYLLWSFAFGGFVLFAAYVLPRLPPPVWDQSWSPPEVRIATSLYFLPKSIEILFQQLLILALVLALAARGLGIGRISGICALSFGGVHVLLALGGMPVGYVVRFMIAATVFGLVFPVLILRVPNGLAYSYSLHWIYYAVTVTMPRLINPSAA
ncbi:MAG: hypothetical protein IT557_14210 [Alphaproteobacteria bacterium]|nr:hypothetical protein [Alphaproteobacteria bacterium]